MICRRHTCGAVDSHLTGCGEDDGGGVIPVAAFDTERRWRVGGGHTRDIATSLVDTHAVAVEIHKLVVRLRAREVLALAGAVARHQRRVAIATIRVQAPDLPACSPAHSSIAPTVITAAAIEAPSCLCSRAVARRGEQESDVDRRRREGADVKPGVAGPLLVDGEGCLVGDDRPDGAELIWVADIEPEHERGGHNTPS